MFNFAGVFGMFFVAGIHITHLMVTVSQANSSESDSATSDNTMAATHRHNEWLPREMRSASVQTAVAQWNHVDTEVATWW